MTCVDTDAQKIDKLRRGEMPIYEPGLAELLQLAAGRGGIDFATELTPAAAESDVIFIAVGTPSLPTGEANLCYLEAAARSIGAAMDDSRFRVVVNKSTVPVGSGNLVETLVREGIRDSHPDHLKRIRFGVASNPEFLREGSAIADSLYPDRIVLGAEEERTLQDAAGIVRAADRAELPGARVPAAPGGHEPRAGGDHHADQRGNDQVRRQCVSGGEDRLRQRDGQHLRAGGRGGAGGDGRASAWMPASARAS